MDDASACGKLSDLQVWWDQISQLGPKFGYFPNLGNTWLIVKEQSLDLARQRLSDTCVNITADGRRCYWVSVLCC